nr:immunoglobulin light chain junction region [Macaca mulatta]MOY06127.1 immunoglobulin light chain junction region [Macaca mulatta]MOY08068.1 immunoglobulin light chain junction region [Macaca mulatta]
GYYCQSFDNSGYVLF